MRYGSDSYLTGNNRYSSGLLMPQEENNGTTMGGLSEILSGS